MSRFDPLDFDLGYISLAHLDDDQLRLELFDRRARERVARRQGVARLWMRPKMASEWTEAGK